MARARHEAGWTDDRATVKGQVGRNRGWVMLAVGFVLIAFLSIFAYNRLMNFQPVTFELRHCQAPIEQGATWADVQAAGCDPATIDGDVVTMWSGSYQQAADSVSESSWTFDDVPVNTVVNALQVDTGAPAESVVLVEPDKESIRVVLSPDASRTKWTGHIGDRASTTMWVLVTPAE